MVIFVLAFIAAVWLNLGFRHCLPVLLSFRLFERPTTIRLTTLSPVSHSAFTALYTVFIYIFRKYNLFSVASQEIKIWLQRSNHFSWPTCICAVLVLKTCDPLNPLLITAPEGPRSNAECISHLSWTFFHFPCRRKMVSLGCTYANEIRASSQAGVRPKIASYSQALFFC